MLPMMAAQPDPTSIFRLDGKVVLITGTSSGLGARFARVLDAAGATVVMAARRIERVEALAGELRDAYAIHSDLSQPNAGTELAHATIERCGRIDVLVNNAGVSNTLKTNEVTNDDFARTIAVNLQAPFELMRETARDIVDNRRTGAIVNIGSIWSMVGVGMITDAPYAASKGGLLNLTRELAAQWARKGVRVNCICPGWFESELTRDAMFDDPNGKAWMESRTPMGRGGAADELDGALLFLASEASSFVTGIALPVDGGWTCV